MTTQDQALIDALNALRRALENVTHGHGYSVSHDLHNAREAITRLENAAQTTREDR